MKHFNEVEDVVFLKELLATPPCHADHGQVKRVWDNISEKVSRCIKREVSPRTLQDRWNYLDKMFAKQDSDFLKASGISEDVTERQVLVREYHELLQVPKPAKSKTPLEPCSIKEDALKRYKDKLETSEQNESDSVGATETRLLPAKRNKQTAFLDILSEQTAASRMTLEEDAIRQRANARLEEEKLQYNRERLVYQRTKHNDNLEIRKRKQEAELRKQELELELRMKQQEADLKRQNVELEIRKKQQEEQQQQTTAILGLINSLAPLITKINSDQKP